jgi:N-methylhydantoinase A
MVRALRVVTVERGIDPRRYALLAFGGAGPLHAAEIADELGIETVLCPRAAGVLAALGLVVSPRRRDVQRTVMLAADDAALEATIAQLGELARAALGAADAELQPTYELRYRGQAFELPVRAPLAGLREAFEAAHEERYGYRDPGGELELVTVRVTATVAGAEVELSAAEPESIKGAVVPLPGSTVYVPEGWTATVDALGSVRLSR